MESLDFVALFVAPLEELEISYMVFGSVASILYGEPRATLDVDLGIYLAPEKYDALGKVFPDTDYYLPPLDVLILEAKRESRGHFNVIHHDTGYKADFYPSRNHPFLDWALENRREFKIGDLSVKLAPPEYVILGKLEFYKEGKSDKHLRDIKGMIIHQEENLDHAFLDKATSELGLTAEWELVKNL